MTQADIKGVALLKGVSLNLGGGRTEEGGNSGELQTSQTSTHVLGMEPLWWRQPDLHVVQKFEKGS